MTDPNGNGVTQSFQGGWIHSSAKGTFTSSTRVMTAYSKAGWVRGSLGWPVSAEACAGASCTQAFAGGIISFSGTAEATSAVGVSAAAIAKVRADPASSPVPLGAAVDATASLVADAHGGGLAQKFTGGWIHSSAAGTFASSNTIMTAYSKAGWLRGKLGWPAGVETCSATSCIQAFQGGSIGYQKGKAAVALVGVKADAIDAAFAEQGGSSGTLGAAVAQLTVVSDPNGNGLARQYANGWIHASAAGAFVTSNSLMSAYSKAGWLRGSLGWPTSDESKVTDPNGNGVTQSFQGGWIHSSAKGTFTSSTRVMTAYSKAGWVRGSLGWPVSAEACAGASCTQAFAGGIISFSGTAEATSAVGVSAAAIAKVRADPASSPVPLGAAVDATASLVADAHGGGLAQKFTGGWIHSSAAGTFASSNTIMTAYSKAGWLRGKLGWPAGVETCSATSCIQAFQGGSIGYQKGKAATVVYR
ncbi:LGFP repeat-containing protein [Microbacterium sp. Mcb102]|uniref:LGFP repeat-containing protein n=1 Tax=Microbacterium sp. Mcb102 TaxID=2926012 RepID=UPI003967BF3B